MCGPPQEPDEASGDRLGILDARVGKKQDCNRSVWPDPGSDLDSGWVHLLQDQESREDSGSQQLILIPNLQLGCLVCAATCWSSC